MGGSAARALTPGSLVPRSPPPCLLVPSMPPPLPALLRQLAAGLTDLVFAPTCLGCGAALPTAAAERLVCGRCWSRVRPLPEPRCERCWNPHPPGPSPPPCPLCATLPAALRVVRSAGVMEGPLRELVHALKYGGWTALAAPLAQRLAALPLPPDVQEEARLVCPVPLGRARRRQRGYNQAELLAAAFARQTGRACRPELLRRTRATSSQTALHPAERRANVAGAFGVPPPLEPDLQGEHVLLVDDVWTTGATALACSAALRAAGARVVSVLTLARALPELDRGEVPRDRPA